MPRMLAASLAVHPVDDRLHPVDLIARDGSVPAPRGQGHLAERRRRRGLAEERCAGAEVRVAGIAKREKPPSRARRVSLAEDGSRVLVLAGLRQATGDDDIAQTESQGLST